MALCHEVLTGPSVARVSRRNKISERLTGGVTLGSTAVCRQRTDGLGAPASVCCLQPVSRILYCVASWGMTAAEVSVAHVDDEIYPPPEAVRKAGPAVRSLDHYHEIYNRSVSDPVGFWSDVRGIVRVCVSDY